MPSQLSRRAMIAACGGAAGALSLAQMAAAQTTTPPPAPQAPEDPTKVQGQLPSPLGARSPFEGPRRLVTGTTASRSPLDALDGIITPADLHYERHHGGVPIIDPSRHTLTVHGMVDRPTVYTLADLQRFPSVSRIMVLECSGNTSWAEGPETSTAQSLHGLTSTSDWSGVPVKTILNEVGVQSGAAWALAEGSDAAVLTRSVPLDKLLDDAMVA
jgi:sulfane dehydrogenase subunit SoxC